MNRTAIFVLAAFVVASSASALTPVKFTTNDGVDYGPYRVSYITVFVDGVKKCYTESHGNCTATPALTPGLHKADYVWATCNNPASCPLVGTVTHFVMVPDQAETYVVRIPTVRVRWYTEYGVGISLNGQQRVWALGGGIGVTNVMSGCYTASYFKPYPGPAPAWPAIPGIPDASLKGFDRVCFGAHTTYPVPVPDSGTDTNPPHIRITVPDYWP